MDGKGGGGEWSGWSWLKRENGMEFGEGGMRRDGRKYSGDLRGGEREGWMMNWRVFVAGVMMRWKKSSSVAKRIVIFFCFFFINFFFVFD